MSGVLKPENPQIRSKVYMRVGEPIYLNEIIANFEGHWDEMEEAVQGTSRDATQIMHGIGQNMLILPTGITALALLSDHGPGISLNTVHERAERYDRLLRHQGAMAAVLSTMVMKSLTKRCNSLLLNDGLNASKMLKVS